MLKLGFLVIAALVGVVVTTLRMARARARMRELDEGKRCVACEGANVHVEVDSARCADCG